MPKMQKVNFDTFFADPLYLLYKNHLYSFVLRRRAIRQSLRRLGGKNVLEVGCGISPMLDDPAGSIQTDISWQGLSYLKHSTPQGAARNLTACEAGRLPFRDGSVERIVCSEVLEHIANDGEVLNEIHRVLKPAGHLILTLPVRAELFSFDDHFVGHFRRYEVKDLELQLKKCGFSRPYFRPILGTLEKFMMERITRIFAALQKGAKKRSLGRGVRWLAWLFFPFYWALNRILAVVAAAEARIRPLDQAVTVLIQCQKYI